MDIKRIITTDVKDLLTLLGFGVTLWKIELVWQKQLQVPSNKRSTDVKLWIENGGYAHYLVSLEKFLDGTEVPTNIPDQAIQGQAAQDLISRLPPQAANSTLEPYLQAMQGFLEGFVGKKGIQNVKYGQDILFTLQYCISTMMNEYRKKHSSNSSAIDDMFFILTIKAVVGKIITTTSINRLMRDPLQQSVLSKTTLPTRMIMGGAALGGANDLIEEAVELYVRLPLLTEFYRRIFDNSNEDIRTNKTTDKPDEELVAYVVPEAGNIWTGLLTNIFDRAKHIHTGIYTLDNMRNIVTEVNSIYRHYKGSVPDAQLIRHIMMELVAEINRRYGVVKREQLMYYYRAINQARKININESNYTTNDLDILNEGLEFEGNAPSDEFLKIKADITNPSLSEESRISKLTDYKILHEFRTRVSSQLDETLTHNAGNTYDPMVNDAFRARIRLLKQAVRTQPSREEKYNMIIKAIESSESIDQSSSDIFACFHEFVLLPLRTLNAMYLSLKKFLENVLKIVDESTTNNLYQLDQDIKDKINAYMLSHGAIVLKPPKFDQDQGKGYYQLLLMDKLVQYATNSGDLIHMNVSTANRITMDFSEYQKVCEHLLANVKFMVDKFTGLVPKRLLDEVSLESNPGSIYQLEKLLLNEIFNKLDLPYGELRDKTVLTLETLNRIMPTISNIIFEPKWKPNHLLLEFALTHYAYPRNETTPTTTVPNTHQDQMNRAQTVVGTPVAKAIPMIRDAFMVYSTQSKTFKPTDKEYYISPLLFDPKSTSTPFRESQLNYGIVQQYNILISRYLNDLYDPQSRKMYTKGFATFAGSNLLDAMNGQSFPDFALFEFPQYQTIRDHSPNNNSSDGYWYYVRNLYENTQTPPTVALEVLRRHYELPRGQTVLSATLAYVMKTMTSRVQPLSGVKVHEVTNLQTISSHILEKYRACIPMHLRIFQAFLKRCRLYKKIISRVKTEGTPLDADITRTFKIGPGTGEAKVVEIDTDAFTVFANPITDDAIRLHSSHSELVGNYLDEIINGVTALIQDITSLQTEFQETDSTVSVFFDIRKDFTKTFHENEKELPFAAPSVLGMGLGEDGFVTRPYFMGGSYVGNKFAYGIRSVLLDNFTLSSKKTPYFKKLVNDFNAISNKNNDLDNAKYDDVLRYVGQALNYVYDLRFYNGLTSFTGRDALFRQGTLNNQLLLFQEQNNQTESLALVENINVGDSRNKIAETIKSHIGIHTRTPQTARLDPNPRSQVMLLNILEMNIMPINVHALMRNIPLANIYNYAMTFDEYVDDFTAQRKSSDINTPLSHKEWKIFLKNPYIDATTVGNEADKYRFLESMLSHNYLNPTGPPAVGVPNPPVDSRLKTKIMRDLVFLVAVQTLIKDNVKAQLEFINTRVVSDSNAISDIITQVQQRDTSGEDNTDNLFQF